MIVPRVRGTLVPDGAGRLPTVDLHSRDLLSRRDCPAVQVMPSGRHAVCLFVVLLAGCASPFDFAPADAVVLPRDRLQALAQQDGPGSMYYCGTDDGYHYLVDPRPGRRRVYKVKAKDLKLEDTFRQGEDEPYLVHPHLLEGRRLGHRPRELPGVEFDWPGRSSEESSPE